MIEGQLHGALVWAIFAMAAATFLILLRFTAPYGRHYPGRGWGPHIANRAGWIVMELPATVMFLYVSCPNYLGELLEWAGWALATWSLGGLAFFVYTAANLVPRARSNHRWYRGRFEDYPESRRAVIPGLI